MIYRHYRRLRSLGGRAYRALQRALPRRPTAVEIVVASINAGRDLTNEKIRNAVARIECQIASRPGFDKIAAHREIGKALFSRSLDLYNGCGLPDYLRRYTYPPVLSIALTSHCNAACFFCRPADYKGRAVDWSDLDKLDEPIRHARAIDLTGWGEPLFYPRFEEVVARITALNPSGQLITLTTNGSFLSARWGMILRGRINRVVISMNAASEATYAAQMRYKNDRFTLAATLAGIQAFQAELTHEDRKRLLLHIVANTDNFREIAALVELSADVGIPLVNIGNFICNDEAHLDKTLWNIKGAYNAELARAVAIGQARGVIVSGRRFFADEKAIAGAERCVAPFEACFVEMPGSVAPCCFMGRARMGNVYDDGFNAVWFGDHFTRLRQARDLPACKVCTVFTPFDDPVAHMSAFLTTKDTKHETPTNLSLMTSRKGTAVSSEPRATDVTSS